MPTREDHALIAVCAAQVARAAADARQAHGIFAAQEILLSATTQPTTNAAEMLARRTREALNALRILYSEARKQLDAAAEALRSDPEQEAVREAMKAARERLDAHTAKTLEAIERRAAKQKGRRK